MNTRKRIYQIIEVAKDGDKPGKAYAVFMMVTIIVSLIPLAFKQDNTFTIALSGITLVIFIADYILRLITADFKLKKGAASFPLYIITPMAIIDVLSMVPSFALLGIGFHLLKVFRLLKVCRLFSMLRVLRAFRTFRYSKIIIMVLRVLKRQRSALIAVGVILLTYILVSALIVLNVEPETFDTFFDAVYWATVSLTTVGYGDLYPVSTAGRVITMISALFGLMVIALPASILTSGFMDELNREDKNNKEINDK